MSVFSPMQREFWKSATHRWNVKTGATRSGKTYMDYFVIPKRLLAVEGLEGLNVILGNTRETVRRNIILPMQSMYGVEYVGNIRQDNSVKMFGQQVFCLGADNANHVDRLRGASFKYCYGDEVTTWNKDVFDMLKSRLDKPYSMFDGTCNPDNPLHWFHEFLQSDADIFQQAYTIDDNPFLSPKFVENLKKEYRGTVLYDRYILGLWVKAEGLVYPMYDNTVKTEPRAYEEFCVSMDYGTYNPTAILLWGRVADVWYIVDEYYHSGRETNIQKTDQQYYDALCDLCGDRPINRIYVDPSAASFITLVRQRGRYHVTKANNDVMVGIQHTASCLVERGVLVNDCCKNTIREFGLYSWDDDEKKTVDAVIKENDHAMDAVRYFVQTKRIWREAGRGTSGSIFG